MLSDRYTTMEGREKTPGDIEKPEIIQHPITSNLLEDILQCSQGVVQRIVVTSATYPYHVEWTNSDWSKACGWQSDEILGLDCKFLQGDVTDQKKVSNFMKMLFSTGGFSDLKVLNYHKDNTLLQNSIRCFPVIDNCGPDFSAQVSHIAAVLVHTKEFTLSEEDMGLMEDWHLKEVGMPIDRREGCHIYPHCNSLSPPSVLEWQVLTENLPLALMLRYMLRSQAPIVLTDREQRIVHVNVSWVNLTGYAAIQCEGKTLSSLFDESTDEKSLQVFSNLVKGCRKTKVDETSYGDESSTQFSTYSSDSESSEDTLFTATPATASIVLLPPTGSVKSSNYKKSFQLNPWGASKIPLRPKLALNVSPAAIKLKHFAFLFSDPMLKKVDKAPKCDLTESPATRKRSKSASAPVTPAKHTTQTQQRPNSPRDSGALPNATCKFAFGTSSYARPFNAENERAVISTSSSDENARKLIKCSSLPPQSAEKARVIFESLTIPAHSVPSASGTIKPTSTTANTCTITRDAPPSTSTYAETDSSLMNKIER